MAFEIEWTNKALDDIEAIALFIEKDSPTYAKSVVSRFFEKAELLKDFPELGHIVSEFNDKKIREILVYSYRMIYKIETNKIIFLVVVHQKRLL